MLQMVDLLCPSMGSSNHHSLRLLKRVCSSRPRAVSAEAHETMPAGQKLCMSGLPAAVQSVQRMQLLYIWHSLPSHPRPLECSAVH